MIVFGVLVALAADSLNDARLERIEEGEYLGRLKDSIASDTVNFRFILDWMDRKESGLMRIDALLRSPRSDFDPDTVLADLAAASNFGWNVGPLTGEATFEDLRSSGKLGLIRNPVLRSKIIEYYEEAEGEDRRMAARRTPYPSVSYELIPFDRPEDDVDEFAASTDVGALLAQIRRSELPRYVLAERNRANFIRASITGMMRLAQELLGDISEALEDGPAPGSVSQGIAAVRVSREGPEYSACTSHSGSASCLRQQNSEPLERLLRTPWTRHGGRVRWFGGFRMPSLGNRSRFSNVCRYAQVISSVGGSE